MQGLYLAMYGDKVELGQALFISLFAMAIVFLVLLIISYLIDITAFVLNRKVKQKKTSDELSKTTVSPPLSNKNGNDDIVVVIAAAIAAYLGTSVDNVKITKIRRIPQNSTTWTERGLLAQIKPSLGGK